jgi:hypothetical protein
MTWKIFLPSILWTVEAGIRRRYIDRRFDKGLDPNYRLSVMGIVGVYPHSLDEHPHIVLCPQDHLDFTHPAGRNGPVKSGRCAASLRANSLYAEHAFAVVENGKGYVPAFPTVPLFQTGRPSHLHASPVLALLLRNRHDHG